MAKVTSAERDALDRKTGELFTRLLTVDCKEQTKQAMLYDGSAALQSAFSVLGRSAMMGLMGDPNVAKGMSGLDKYLDSQKILQALGTESAALPSTSNGH